MQDWKMTGKGAGLENAGQENDGQRNRGWKMKTNAAKPPRKSWL